VAVGSVVSAGGAVVADAGGNVVTGATVSSGNVPSGNVVEGVSLSSLSKAPPIQAISTTAARAAIATITQRAALRLTALVRAAFASSACRLARFAF